jgi:hypothetical protein
LAAAAFTFRSFLLWLWFSFFAIARKMGNQMLINL